MIFQFLQQASNDNILVEKRGFTRILGILSPVLQIHYVKLLFKFVLEKRDI